MSLHLVEWQLSQTLSKSNTLDRSLFTRNVVTIYISAFEFYVAVFADDTKHLANRVVDVNGFTHETTQTELTC